MPPLRRIWASLACLCLVLGITSAGDECQKLKDLDYELFGTKTIYEDARKTINKKGDKLPKSFDDDTLEEEHKEMLEDSCIPVVFYFVGRHSARFPDGEDIEIYNKQLGELKNLIKRQKSFSECPSKFQSFQNWTSRMQPKHDNLITELGAREEQNIAKRFKRIYPEFFKTDKADVNIGVTTKIRTAQTGAEFLKEVDGLKIADCDLMRSLPSNDVYKPNYSIDKILQDNCYKSMMDKHAKPFLEFHKNCDKIAGKDKQKEPLVERVKKDSVTRKIREHVAERLGLDAPTITGETLESIFNMCKFENAMKDESVWCRLFKKKDVEALEYIEDVSTYIKNAYGPKANARQSCPLVKHLIETIQAGTKLTGSPSEKRKAHFYFSHATPMKKLLATFDMFKDDSSFTESKIQEFERDYEKIPKRREWRSSLISPFSANMAFVLYRCQKSGKEVKHKILATVGERPVKLGGCKETDCNLAKFLDTYNGLRDCDLNKVCRQSG